MTLDPVPLRDEELGWFRGQRSGSFRRAETGARLLATIDARDQRIKELEDQLRAITPAEMDVRGIWPAPTTTEAP